MTLPVLGFIGLGAMGAPMARNLLKAGYPVHVFNRSIEKSNRLAPLGAVVCADLHDVGSAAEIILLCLPDSYAVEAVVLGTGGLVETIRKGQILIDLSTSDPDSTRAISRVWSEKGGLMLDAPVSGGTSGAEAGTLSLMVGGDDSVLEHCRPVFDVLGSRIFHTGPVSTGHTLKAVNNLLYGTLMVASCEAVSLGVKAGIDPRILLEVIRHSSGRNLAIETKFPGKVLTRDFTPGFTTDLLHKDMHLALEMARRIGMELPLGTSAMEKVAQGQTSGWGGEDHIALIRWYEARYGIRIE